MNTDSDRLLEDILKEAAPEDFRNMLLSQTLGRVRRRRRVRAVSRASMMIVAAGLLLFALRNPIQERPAFRQNAPAVQAVAPKAPSYGLVRSQPLPPEFMVETEPGSVSTVSSTGTSVAVVRSRPAAELFAELSDDELLELCAGRPAALVRQDEGRADLVFVNPQDRFGFQVQ